MAIRALVFPSELPSVALEGLVVAAALILVARPVAVFLTLAPFRVPWRERALISWVGLRGAAPIILATLIALIEHEGEFVVPTGSTELHDGDRLLILGSADGIEEFRRRIAGEPG